MGHRPHRRGYFPARGGRNPRGHRLPARGTRLPTRPHHNVYWITSTTWDLRKLQALLQSDMVTDQLRAHSMAMRGGSLRYQAQNLRRVRIPV